MKPNVQLLKRTLRHIKRYPEKWNQGKWCGTTCCFAGRACLLSGFKQCPYSPGCVIDKYGVISLVEWTARELLELTRYQALSLFSAANSLADLTQIVNEICKMQEV